MENRKQQSGIDSVHGASAVFERVVCRSCRDSCGCSSLSPSWHGNVADGFPWSEPRRAGGLWF